MDWIELVVSRPGETGAWVMAVEVALKSLLLMALALATAQLLGRRSAALRQTVWTAALVGLLALPLLTALGPDWRVTVLETPLDTRPAAVAPLPDGEISTGVTPAATVTAAATAQTSPARWVLPAWLAGALAVSARWLYGIAALRRRLRTSRPVRDLAWRRELLDLARLLGVRRRVEIHRSDRLPAPLTWGVFRPVILVPAAAAAWPASLRRTVLLHELLHVRRGDLLVEHLTQLACAFYWFNPLVWVAARRLRLERERACDDAVLAHGTRASDYASQLLYMAVRSRHEAAPAGVSMAARRQLEGRLLAILDPDRRRSVALPALLVALVAGCMAVVPLAAFSPAVELLGGETPLEIQRHTASSHDLRLQAEGAEIVDGELVLENGGWFRVESAGPPARVVELRRTGSGESRTYLVDGQEQSWDAEADRLLSRGIDMKADLQAAHRDLERAHQELRRVHEELEKTRHEAHAEIAEARRDIERQHQELRRRMEELHERHELQAHELEQRHRELGEARAQLEHEWHQNRREQEQVQVRMEEARQRQAEQMEKNREEMAQEMNAVRERMEQARLEMREARSQLEQKRADIADQLARQILDAVRQSGVSVDGRVEELAATTASGLTRSGSIDVDGSNWTFQADAGALRELASALAARLPELDTAGREALTDRLVERLAVVTGN